MPPQEMAYMLDQDPVENFLNEWSIFRRNLTTYPAQHPILGQSGQRVAKHLENLSTTDGGLKLGVLKDKLLINGAPAGENNPKISRFAQSLHQLGIAGLTLKPGIPWEELAEFSRLLEYTREEIQEKGGFSQLSTQLGLHNIHVTEVDYTSLQTTEEKIVKPTDTPITMWEDFITGLLDASIGAGGSSDGIQRMTPATLAQFLNEKFGHSQTQLTLEENPALASTFGKLIRKSASTTAHDPARQQLLQFIRHLHPEVRKQFLEGGIRLLGEDASTLELLLSELPSSTLTEMVQAQRQLETGKEPPLLKMLHKLVDAKPVRLRPQNLDTDSGTVQALHTIFREDESELFITGEYRDQLNRLIRLEKVPSTTTKEVEALKNSLETQSIESKLCAVILEVSQSLPSEEQADLLSRNLLDISTYFLELGDFSALVNLYDRLQKDARDAKGSLAEVIDQALSNFYQTDFVREVLASLHLWGKPKYREVQAFIRRIGKPFIDPLLDALAEEESMSLRRYYMECLGRMGPMIRPYLVARIEDERWYFVRNLVVLLRQLNEPTILASLEGLRDHKHLRVRQEVIRTYIQFNDNRAIKVLQAELDSESLDEQLQAIRMAEKSRSPVILRKLISMLSLRDLSDEGLRLQTAVIRALAELGDSQALPELKRIIGSRSLFHPVAQNKLKVEVVRSLGRYPAEKVQKALDQLAESRTRAIALAAKESLKQLQRRRS